MKLSDIKGERTIDVIAEIIEPIANIAADKEAAKLFRVETLPAGADVRKHAAARLSRSVPKLLKSHKQDVIAILAAIKGQTSAEYAESLNLAVFLADAYELVSDEAFIDLFTSAQTDSGFGSAQANIEEAEA